ncbi:MAG: hypothetical protein K0S65_4375 [Labilithrix sp.]|nr:hypothetical protein [Labilithrix sp.]
MPTFGAAAGCAQRASHRAAASFGRHTRANATPHRWRATAARATGPAREPPKHHAHALPEVASRSRALPEACVGADERGRCRPTAKRELRSWSFRTDLAATTRRPLQPSGGVAVAFRLPNRKLPVGPGEALRLFRLRLRGKRQPEAERATPMGLFARSCPRAPEGARSASTRRRSNAGRRCRCRAQSRVRRRSPFRRRSKQHDTRREARAGADFVKSPRTPRLRINVWCSSWSHRVRASSSSRGSRAAVHSLRSMESGEVGARVGDIWSTATRRTRMEPRLQTLPSRRAPFPRAKVASNR